MIFGIDVSSYQDTIDMTQVAAEGLDFAFVKVGQGAGTGDLKPDGTRAVYGESLNPAWPAQRDGAHTAGMLLAGYWYIGNTETPESQAARCKAAMGDTTIPLMLDWEDASGDWDNFLAVLAAFRAAGLRVVLGYCPSWYGASHGMTGFPAAGLALVSSKYPSMSPGTPAQLYGQVDPSYWGGYCTAPAPTILQFSEAASVAGHTCDANAFAGTRDQLAALLGGTQPAPSASPRARRLGEDTSMLVTTPQPAQGSAKPQWPAQRISFGFDPIGGWGGNAAIKLHWTAPGGWITSATWWVRGGTGVGQANRPHTPVAIPLAGVQERFVGLGWELYPPAMADELEVVISAPGGCHIFSVYQT